MSATGSPTDETSAEPEHTDPNCPGDDWTACHDGVIYGPCGSEFCNGTCECVGACICMCHDR